MLETASKHETPLYVPESVYVRRPPSRLSYDPKLSQDGLRVILFTASKT